MRKLREILRLHLEMGMSARAIARSCSLSPSTVSGYLGRVEGGEAELAAAAGAGRGRGAGAAAVPHEGHPTREPSGAGLGAGAPGAAQEARHQAAAVGGVRDGRSRTGYQYSQFCERYARGPAR